MVWNKDSHILSVLVRVYSSSKSNSYPVLSLRGDKAQGDGELIELC